MFKYNLSYWEQESFLKDIDVAVIGSGIVGLNAAIHLKNLQPHLQVAIFERGMLPTGASTRNAGFACFGSMTELMEDIRQMGEDAMLAVVEKRWRGLHALRSLVGDAHLDFKMLGGYEMFTDDDEDIYWECAGYMEEMNHKIGAITGDQAVYKTVDAANGKFGFKGVQHLILNQREGQVHTGKMMKALMDMALEKGIRIFNGLEITSLEDSRHGVEMQTAYGWTIQVPRVLLAVNGFAKRLLPDLPVVPARNQVLITKPIPGLKVEGCFHYDRGYYYFRNIDGRILLGGGRNLAQTAEQTDEFGPNELIRSSLVQLLRRVICPGYDIEVDAWWTGILGTGPAKHPIVEKVSDNVAVAVRLSGMGVAIGTLIGQEGAELVVA